MGLPNLGDIDLDIRDLGVWIDSDQALSCQCASTSHVSPRPVFSSAPYIRSFRQQLGRDVSLRL